MSAFGTTGFGGHGFSKSFTEHSVIIGLINVYADLTYQQGLNRMFSRQDRWDFYWPALAHLGEQAVLNKEIYAQGTADDDAVFGYQERFAEYRYKPSMVTGQMRSNYAQSLDVWHLAQDFTSLPARFCHLFFTSSIVIPRFSKSLSVLSFILLSICNPAAVATCVCACALANFACVPLLAPSTAAAPIFCG